MDPIRDILEDVQSIDRTLSLRVKEYQRMLPPPMPGEPTSETLKRLRDYLAATNEIIIYLRDQLEY